MDELRQLQLPKHAIILPMEQCEGKSHLNEFLDKILKEGGEGVNMTKPHSFYIAGMQAQLLEVIQSGFLCLQYEIFLNQVAYYIYLDPMESKVLYHVINKKSMHLQKLVLY